MPFHFSAYVILSVIAIGIFIAIARATAGHSSVSKDCKYCKHGRRPCGQHVHVHWPLFTLVLVGLLVLGNFFTYTVSHYLHHTPESASPETVFTAIGLKPDVPHPVIIGDPTSDVSGSMHAWIGLILGSGGGGADAKISSSTKVPLLIENANGDKLPIKIPISKIILRESTSDKTTVTLVAKDEKINDVKYDMVGVNTSHKGACRPIIESGFLASRCDYTITFKPSRTITKANPEKLINDFTLSVTIAVPAEEMAKLNK